MYYKKFDKGYQVMENEKFLSHSVVEREALEKEWCWCADSDWYLMKQLLDAEYQLVAIRLNLADLAARAHDVLVNVEEVEVDLLY